MNTLKLVLGKKSGSESDSSSSDSQEYGSRPGKRGIL